MDWAATAISELWRHAWAVVPVAIGAVMLTRWMPLRPTTRHGLWVVVLIWFIAPLLLPKPPEDSITRVSLLAEQAADRLAEVTRPAKQTHLFTVPHTQLPPAPARRSVVPVTALNEERFPSAEVPAASAAPMVRPTPWRPPSLPLASGSGEPRTLHQRDALEFAALPLPDGQPEPHKTLAPQPIEPVRQDEPTVALTEPTSDPERTSALALWLGAFRSVRTTLSQLPAMPANIWIGGAVLIALWHLVGLTWFAMRMRKARPAPRWVVREVRRVALRCGLQRIPQVRMIDACISPLVLTGLRPQLYLPVHLWDELDRVGRRAILCHELAHLRRGDDWVRWGELIVSTICWWHPLVWWVRGRIHEEADLSCDSWVTWLMPEGRRAYAEALLRTKAYVSTGGGSMPAVGLGATSVGARKFARRLTMVMTKTSRPGNSVSGGVLLAGLMVIGWAALPAFSCPPQDCEKQDKRPLAVTAPAAPALPARVQQVPAMPRLAVTAPAAPRPIAVTQRPRGFAQAPARAHFEPQRPIAVTTRAPGLTLASAGDDNETRDRVRDLERQLRDMQNELRNLSRGMRSQNAQPRAPRPSRPATPFDHGHDADSDELIIRQYKMSKGRLKELTELMVRDDVPVLVRPMDHAIEVHATARHHRIFKAFVEMIEGRETAHGHDFPHGHGQHGDARAHLERALALQHEAQARAHKEHAEHAQRARNHQARAEQVRHMLMTKREHMMAEARNLFEKAEALNHEAEHLRDKADGVEDDKARRKELSRAAREIEKKSREIERAAEKLEREVEALERQAERQQEELEEEWEDEEDEWDEDDTESAVWLESLDGVENVGVTVREALLGAAGEIRGQAMPEVEVALAEALAEVEQNAPHLLGVLEPILVTDEGVVYSVLEGVASGLEEAADSNENLMDQILETLEDVVEENDLFEE